MKEEKSQRRKDIEAYLYDLFVFWPSFFSTASIIWGLMIYVFCSLAGIESIRVHLCSVFKELGTAPMCMAMTPYLFRVYANPLIVKTIELFKRK